MVDQVTEEKELTSSLTSNRLSQKQKDTLQEIAGLLDDSAILTGDDVSARLSGKKDFSQCCAAAIIRPKNTEEVSKVLKVCFLNHQSVVTQGGMSGMVEGAVANENSFVISLERMNNIESLDKINRTITAQAGVPLQMAQELAETHELIFPVDFGARGSATLGGMVATNAGGNKVIHYGMTRDNLLGLEVVLADGTIINSMSKLIKNNTGFDLKHLFTGSEGILGIVTKVIFKLSPKPKHQHLAFVAVDQFDKLVSLLHLLKDKNGENLCAFEVMWSSYYKLVTEPLGPHKPPIENQYPYYVLLEINDWQDDSATSNFESLLEIALEEEIICDAVITQSTKEANALWAMRDNVEQVAQLWPIFIFDVSLPLDKMESYLNLIENQLQQQWAEAKHAIFGHLGDGNLHIIVGVGCDAPETKKSVEAIIYQNLLTHQGSVSAEHGIGTEKKPYLNVSRTENEIAVMKIIKKSLDTRNILNPGNVLSV